MARLRDSFELTRATIAVLDAVVGYEGGKVTHEHIYWDQASLLVQVGLLDPTILPVRGVEVARWMRDRSEPLNRLLKE